MLNKGLLLPQSIAKSNEPVTGLTCDVYILVTNNALSAGGQNITGVSFYTYTNLNLENVVTYEEVSSVPWAGNTVDMSAYGTVYKATVDFPPSFLVSDSSLNLTMDGVIYAYMGTPMASYIFNPDNFQLGLAGQLFTGDSEFYYISKTVDDILAYGSYSAVLFYSKSQFDTCNISIPTSNWISTTSVNTETYDAYMTGYTDSVDNLIARYQDYPMIFKVDIE